MNVDQGENSVSNEVERSTPMHDKTTTSPADEVVGRALYRELMDGWNQGSSDAIAAVFTEHGDLIAFDARALQRA
jgi:hypothetical protein